MNKLVKFFHELRHPHCEHCEAEKIRIFDAKMEEAQQNARCTSCETLETTNNSLIRENSRLVEALIDKNKVQSIVEAPPQDLKPIRTTSHIPWNTRRQMKETESRAALRDMQTAAQPNKIVTTQSTGIVKDDELAEIEKELGEINGSGTTEKTG